MICIPALLLCSVALLEEFAVAAPEAPAEICSPVRKAANGVSWGASRTAHQFSMERRGNVGISIYPGAELKESKYTADQIGVYLVEQLQKGSDVIRAKCFVNERWVDGGTSINFKVYGISIPKRKDPRIGGVNLEVALDANTINAVKGEATLVSILYE